jgi:hypothetical protein
MDRQEWIMNRCTYRVVPQEEIDALIENSGPAPIKVAFRNFDGVLRDGLDAIAKRRRAVKRASELLESSEDDHADLDADLADSDFNPNHPDETEARHSHNVIAAATSSPKQTVRSAKRAKSSLSVPSTGSLLDAASADPELEALDQYCPCSVHGHACKMTVCTKTRLDNCHDLKPSCFEAVLDTCAEDHLCDLGHDYIAARQHIARDHKCNDH